MENNNCYCHAYKNTIITHQDFYTIDDAIAVV